MRLRLIASYNQVILEVNSQQREYSGGFYVLNSSGRMTITNPTKSKKIVLTMEVPRCWIPGGRPLNMNICSKPISRSEIHEIDEALRPDDVQIQWEIYAYGFLGGKCSKEFNAGLIPIFIGTDGWHNISRMKFVKNVIEPADMLKREFIEVMVEPIDVSHVKDSEARDALETLLEKQKLLLGAMNKLTEAKTATDFRGIIDEVRRAVEGLKLGEPYKKIYKMYYIESRDAEAIEKASEEMVETLNMSLKAIYKYTSRFGIHTTTLPRGTEPKRVYTPIPTRAEAEFAVQQAVMCCVPSVIKHNMLRVGIEFPDVIVLNENGRERV